MLIKKHWQKKELTLYLKYKLVWGDDMLVINKDGDMFSDRRITERRQEKTEVKEEKRKTDRRKASSNKVERRQGERRKTERRKAK